MQVPGAAEASIRNLPPSAIGDPSNLDAMSLLAANKGRPMEGIVEQVRDGSTVRIYLLPEFQFVQVFVAGIQVCIHSGDHLGKELGSLILILFTCMQCFWIFISFPIWIRLHQWEEGLQQKLLLKLK